MKTGVLGAGGHFVTSPEIREYAKIFEYVLLTDSGSI
jgi:hypothetical protein